MMNDREELKAQIDSLSDTMCGQPVIVENGPLTFSKTIQLL